MLNKISFYKVPIIKMPFATVLGIIALIFMLAAAIVPIANLPFTFHKPLAGIAILFALTHGTLMILAKF